MIKNIEDIKPIVGELQSIKPVVGDIQKLENKPVYAGMENTTGVIIASSVTYSQHTITYSQTGIQYGGLTGSSGLKPKL